EMQGYYAGSQYMYMGPYSGSYWDEWLTFERSVSNGHEVSWAYGSATAVSRVATFGELHRGADQAAGSLPSGYASVSAVSTVPARSSIGGGLAVYLNSQSDTTTAKWLQHELDPRCSPDPTSAA